MLIKNMEKEIRDQKEAMYTEQHKAKAKKKAKPQEKDER